MLNKFNNSKFQIEKNKIIRDAKIENSKVKREKRMLKSKVSKILGECLPSIKSVTKRSFNHKNCMLTHEEEKKKESIEELNKFRKDSYKDSLNKFEKHSHYQSVGCIHSTDKKTM